MAPPERWEEEEEERQLAPRFVLPRHAALEQEMLRRADEQQQQQQQQGGDPRRERKMKNRESAARSRARRHAYVSELEKEVELLRAENHQLRRLYHELKKAAEGPVPVPVPVKKRPAHHQQLQRTSSAPM
ncbi:hypothetical protein U9M48_037886 [Paspalum notatum var. saurae]|uniref:BZIP domain-containing protein n=1 Tax=Paspalum notatum var. saurae TaxID=547442 RepID=A0AAQ3UK68_PASNO